MMRQSMAHNRMSQAPSAAVNTKMLEKKKEYDAISALERASALYLERINNLADDFDVMADGGEVFGQVLAQWPQMFQILTLFLKAREEQTTESTNEMELARDLLVRIPIDEIRESSETQNTSR